MDLGSWNRKSHTAWKMAALLDLRKEFLTWLSPQQWCSSNVFVSDQPCFSVMHFSFTLRPLITLLTHFSSLLWLRRAFGNVNRHENKLVKTPFCSCFDLNCVRQKKQLLHCDAWVKLDIYSYNRRFYDFTSIFSRVS